MSANLENDPDFNPPAPKPIARRRFKLSEIAAALGAILLLIALLLPAVRSGSGGVAARRAQCTNCLKQIVLALHQYAQEYGALPPAHTVDANGRPLHSWRTLVLPYLEEQRLYRTIDLSRAWNDPANAKALATPVDVFHCPGADGPKNTTTYLAIASPNGGLLPDQPRPFASIADPHATLMLIEAGEDNAVPWMVPFDAHEALVLNAGPTAKLHHPGGTNAAFVDGSARFIKLETPSMVLRALMSVSGNDADHAEDR
jgi:prepilin-type processing-associated H-X9-DG protein